MADTTKENRTKSVEGEEVIESGIVSCPEEPVTEDVPLPTPPVVTCPEETVSTETQ